MAGRAVKLREQTQAFRLGKVTAAAFYITLAGAFGAKRHTMIPKVLTPSSLALHGGSGATQLLQHGLLGSNTFWKHGIGPPMPTELQTR